MSAAPAMQFEDEPSQVAPVISKFRFAAVIAVLACLWMTLAHRPTAQTRSSEDASPSRLRARSSMTSTTTRSLVALAPSGKAVAGASVLSWVNGSLTEVAITDFAGAARWTASPLAQRTGVLVVAPRFAPKLAWIEPDADATAQVELERGIAFDVNVTTADGQPAVGAVVRLCVSGWELGSSTANEADASRTVAIDPPTLRRYLVVDGVGLRPWTAIADEQGVARFVDLPAGVRAFVNVDFGPPQRTVRSTLLTAGAAALAWKVRECAVDS